jgi:hypothetical protein
MRLRWKTERGEEAEEEILSALIRAGASPKGLGVGIREFGKGEDHEKAIATDR